MESATDLQDQSGSSGWSNDPGDPAFQSTSSIDPSNVGSVKSYPGVSCSTQQFINQQGMLPTFAMMQLPDGTSFQLGGFQSVYMAPPSLGGGMARMASSQEVDYQTAMSPASAEALSQLQALDNKQQFIPVSERRNINLSQSGNSPVELVDLINFC